jgi:hypothetical protein
MKYKIYILLILLTIIEISDVFAQRGEWVNQVIVVNSGKFEYDLPAFEDYVTVQAYDPVTHVVKVFDTIYTQSAQDIVIDGHFAYVAAQDSIIKYNIDNYQRIAAIADSGMAKLCFYNNRLIVSKQYPVKRFFVEILDANLALLDFVDGISGECGGISADKDSVYVAVNHGWAGTDGRLAVIDINTWTLTREVNYGTTAVGIMDLYNYSDRIISVNKTPYGYPPVGSLTNYNIYTGSFHTNNINYTVGEGAGIVDNLLYLLINEGIGSYNLDTQSIVDPAIVPDPGSANHINILSSGVDYINDRLYLNIGTRNVNGYGLITTLSGDSLSSFPEGISSDCMAVDYRTSVGIQPAGTKDESLTFFPNPVDNILTVRFKANSSFKDLKVMDLTGRIVYEQKGINDNKSLRINCEAFHPGIYFLSFTSDQGITTKKFLKK